MDTNIHRGLSEINRLKANFIYDEHEFGVLCAAGRHEQEPRLQKNAGDAVVDGKQVLEGEE